MGGPGERGGGDLTCPAFADLIRISIGTVKRIKNSRRKLRRTCLLVIVGGQGWRIMPLLVAVIIMARKG